MMERNKGPEWVQTREHLKRMVQEGEGHSHKGNEEEMSCELDRA